MRYINLTPHDVSVQTEGCFSTFSASGVIARVESRHVISSKYDEIPLFSVEYGDVYGLPEPEEGTLYIVSLLVMQASSRTDLVAPASGHPDVVRVNGQIHSVPGFVAR